MFSSAVLCCALIQTLDLVALGKWIAVKSVLRYHSVLDFFRLTFNVYFGRVLNLANVNSEANISHEYWAIIWTAIHFQYIFGAQGEYSSGSSDSLFSFRFHSCSLILRLSTNLSKKISFESKIFVWLFLLFQWVLEFLLSFFIFNLSANSHR